MPTGLGKGQRVQRIKKSLISIRHTKLQVNLIRILLVEKTEGSEYSREHGLCNALSELRGWWRESFQQFSRTLTIILLKLLLLDCRSTRIKEENRGRE